MKFEWDENKNKINIQKHGVDFRNAALVFTDKNRIEKFDEKHSAEEERYITIGYVNHILTVVYTERVDIKRIISARKATKREMEEYYHVNGLL